MRRRIQQQPQLDAGVLRSSAGVYDGHSGLPYGIVALRHNDMSVET